ncbi:hypothetical protein CDEST_15205 [Colletotrichum destructivum]|uniref:Uncharacterized protein n=1 Tax=Colletotrichum destructivum TaxID=34406 RepID=A0AAX4J3U4_9PEZI|nr:hypothetical protein CDEST_15205 [Colletotrichum destructivum]
MWCVVEGDDDDTYKQDGEGEDVRSAPAATSPPYNPLTSPEILLRLKKEFGGLIAPDTRKGITAFDQSLLAGLFACNLQLDLASTSTKPPPGFVLYTRKTVSALLRANALHSHPDINLDSQSDKLDIVLVDTSLGSKRAVVSRYNYLETYLVDANATCTTTIYPARDEAYAEGNKLDEIRALDRVSQAQHTWRPKTCFSAGPCTLADVARDFKKRSWSSSSGHATIDDSKAVRLTCTTTATLRKPPPRKRQCVRRATPSSDPNGHWFLQKYVETLAGVEFRVYVIAEPHPTDTRGLRGCIARIWCTEPIPDSHGTLTATEAIGRSYQNHGLPEHAVKSFALSVHEALRAGDRWAAQFRSLSVGCRPNVSL